jgi:hypothetical protein
MKITGNIKRNNGRKEEFTKEKEGQSERKWEKERKK